MEGFSFLVSRLIWYVNQDVESSAAITDGVLQRTTQFPARSLVRPLLWSGSCLTTLRWTYSSGAVLALFPSAEALLLPGILSPLFFRHVSGRGVISLWQRPLAPLA